jgi:hypothetical protein
MGVDMVINSALDSQLPLLRSLLATLHRGPLGKDNNLWSEQVRAYDWNLLHWSLDGANVTKSQSL